MKVTVFFVLAALLLAFTQGVPSISTEQAKELLSEKKAVLVDVREQEEVASGMLEGALWIPLSGLQASDAQALKTLESVNKEQEVITYCRSGTRSGKAGAILIKKGYRVRNLGGYEAAKAAGIGTK